MISTSRLKNPAFTIVTPREPFAFADLAAQARADADLLGAAAVFGTPLLLDFRQINLLKFDADDFQRVISRRFRINDTNLDVPCALVAANETNFGMLRMYNAYAEARHLRKSEMTFLTTDFDAAKIWINRAASQWAHTRSSSSAAAN